jgi:hypothetical protein
MDITDAPQARIDIGVEELVHGGSLTYHNVVFCWDKPNRPTDLVVLSYSDCAHQENIQVGEAEEKMTRSKLVAEDLAKKSSVFKSTWQKTTKHFHFCYDYGSGAILLAKESNGRIVWIGK